MRDKLIQVKANELIEWLNLFTPRDRIFVLSEVVRLCQRRLQSRESSRYHVDFTHDEPPTNPSSSLGERETRKINVAELQELIRKGQKDGT